MRKISPHRDSIPGPPSPYAVAIPTTLPGPHFHIYDVFYSQFSNQYLPGDHITQKILVSKLWIEYIIIIAKCIFWLFTLYFGRFSTFFICFSFLNIWKRILPKSWFLSNILKRMEVLTPVGYAFFYFLNSHFDILPSLLNSENVTILFITDKLHVNSCELLRSQIGCSPTFKIIVSAVITPHFVEYSRIWKTFGFEGAGLEGSFSNAGHMCCNQKCQWMSAADAGFISNKAAMLCWEIKETRCPCHAYRYLIYLLNAIGLSPGGSSTVHIYTQTIHRTTQNKQYIQQQNNLGECGLCPVLASYTLAFALQLRKKHGKTSVRVVAPKNT